MAAKGAGETKHYLMVLEPAHIDRQTGEVMVWSEPADHMLREVLSVLAENPFVSTADRDAVLAAVRDVTAALHFFRFHDDSAVRTMGLNGMAGALLSGLHHGGGTDFAVRLKAQAEAAGSTAAKSKQTQACRNKLAETDEAQRDAQLFRKVAKPMVFRLWRHSDSLYRKYKKTWIEIESEYFAEMARRVPLGHRLLKPIRRRGEKIEYFKEREITFSTMVNNRLKQIADTYDATRAGKVV